MFSGNMSIMLSTHATCLVQIEIFLKKQHSIALERNMNTNDPWLKIKLPNPTLHENQIFKFCRASTEYNYLIEMEHIMRAHDFSAPKEHTIVFKICDQKFESKTCILSVTSHVWLCQGHEWGVM